MTEVEWLSCSTPEPMLALLRDRGANDRKLRLFGVACCRRVQHLMADEGSRAAIPVAEAFADGLVGEADRRQAQERADAARDRAQAEYDAVVDESTYAESDEVIAGAWRLLVAVEAAAAASAVLTLTAFASAGEVVRLVRSTEQWVEEAARWAAGEGRTNRLPSPSEDTRSAALLRDVFNPFRAATIEPACITPTVSALAQRVYDTRDFSAMPVLADALQDAGCQDEEILGHCRGGGAHVKGCWVVDLVLGKE